jgi:hypothetical protein
MFHILLDTVLPEFDHCLEIYTSELISVTEHKCSRKIRDIFSVMKRKTRCENNAMKKRLG